MNYYFRYLIQYSTFFNTYLKRNNAIYFDASYLYNYQSSCYNLISKKKFDYFIDPVTFKFQYGGNRTFYLNYVNYFNELEDLFDSENKIRFDILNSSEKFNDFYKKTIRFQRTMLASTQIPLDFYIAIANGSSEALRYNPIEQLSFVVSPYFEFYELDDKFYRFNIKFSEINSNLYMILRFHKEILNDRVNIEKLFKDFNKVSGILINIINLDQYDLRDLDLYFSNLIDLIFMFANNNQNVLLMNNSEFGKYFGFFGLKNVCSNVMIGQRTTTYEPIQESKGRLSTDFSYIPQIERSVSLINSESLISRNKKIKKIYPQGVINMDFKSRIEKYYDIINEKVNKIHTMEFNQITKSISDNYNHINFDIHKKRYKYILKWEELLTNKYNEYFN